MSKKNDLWMPIYIGDYLADTGHLSTTQHGVYLLLLMHYWRKRELPADDKQLAAIAKLPLRIWMDNKDTIQAFFHDGWKHKRIEEELDKRSAVSSKRAAAGAKGGSRPRKEDSGQGEGQGRASEQELSKCSVLLEQNGSMTQSQSHFDVADDARGRRSLISQTAFDVTGELERAFGFHLPEEIPPGWCGCAMWVQKCLDEGWGPREMVGAGKVIAKRAKRPIMSFNYLEKPMAEFIAEYRRPLPQVEVKQAEKLTVVTNGRQQGNIIQASDRLLDTIKSFDAGPGENNNLRSGAGETPTRLLSQG